MAPGAPLPSDRPDLPRLVDGISSWPFFPEKRTADGTLREDGVSIVGSLELDRFMTVPHRKLAALETMLQSLRQSRSFEEAEQRLRRQGIATDLSVLCDKLWDAGLVLDETGRPVPADTPLERNFVRLARVSLRPVEPAFRWIGRNLPGVSIVLVLLLVLVWSFDLLGGLRTLPGFLPPEGATWSGVISGLLLLGGSFFFHELSHGAVAARFGRIPKRFELGFYLGFLPTFFLRVGGLYTLTPRQRVCVWAAGPACNLVLAATTALLALNTDGKMEALWARAMYLNLALGLFNLVPFLPTDGYFIASTLLRRTNVRRRAWSSVRDFLAGGRRPALVLGLYAAGFAGVVGFLFGGRLIRILGELPEHPLSSLARLALMLGFIGLVVARWRRAKRTRGRKRQRDGGVATS
jgi:putative peptide zinc metalloprotease protein